MFGCSVNSVYIRIIRLRVHLQYDKVLVRERARHSPTSRIFSIHSEFIFCVSFRVRDAPPPDPRRLLRRLPFRESLPSAPQLRADATLRRRAGKAARRSRTDPSCCSAEPFLMKKERGKGGGAGEGGGGGGGGGGALGFPLSSCRAVVRCLERMGPSRHGMGLRLH